jgi:hypothetical protein
VATSAASTSSRPACVFMINEYGDEFNLVVFDE